MVGTGRRVSVGIALAVGLLVAAVGIPTAAAQTSAGDLTLHIGSRSAFFQYTPPDSTTLTQSMPSGTQCGGTFAASPDLVDVSASAPEGATLGRWQGKLGVCFQDPARSPRSGRIDGDKGEALTFQLGTDPSLANVEIQSADLHVSGQGTLTANAYLGTTMVGTATIDSATTPPQGTGRLANKYVLTLAPDAVFDRVVLTAGAGSYYGVIGSKKSGDTVFHLESTGGTLDPGQTAPPASGGGATATLTFDNGPAPINYNLVVFNDPDGTHNVELTKPSDPSQRFTMVIDWGNEPFCDFTHGLCPHTQIDFDDSGPMPPQDAQLCGVGEPNATVMWCISDQHYTIVQGNPQQVHLVETFSGWGDTHWFR